MLLLSSPYYEEWANVFEEGAALTYSVLLYHLINSMQKFVTLVVISNNLIDEFFVGEPFLLSKFFINFRLLNWVQVEEWIKPLQVWFFLKLEYDFPGIRISMLGSELK